MIIRKNNTSFISLKAFALFLLAFTSGFANNSSTSYVNANFRYSVACVGQAVQFFDETIPAEKDKIISWFWSFGDNTGPSVMQDPTHTFKKAGEYTVSLHILSESGAKGAFAKIVNVNDIPQADFTSENSMTCVGKSINFSDASTLKDGEISEWKWEFSDGTSSLNQNPSKSFSQSGNFNVTLTVISEDGCSAKKTIKDFVKVSPKPNADFSVSNKYPTTINPSVTFITPKNTDDNKLYIWYFGDGDSVVASSNTIVSHDYPDGSSKTYKPKLIVVNQNDCSDTSFYDITVNPEFTFYMPNAFTPNGDGINEYFSGTGIGITQYEITIFNKQGTPVFTSDDMDKKWDGNDKFSENVPAPDGVYAWVVYVTDAFGKKHKYMGQVNVIR